MNKEKVDLLYETIVTEIEKIKDNEAIINNNHYFGLDKELLTYIRFLEQEIKEYQLELEKADSITQSCILNRKKDSETSFRKCLNELKKIHQENKHIKGQQKEFMEWLEKESKEIIRDAGYHQRICEEILEKYKEIIGSEE